MHFSFSSNLDLCDIFFLEIDISFSASLVSAETVCMAKKEKAEEKEKEAGEGGGGERDEEMEDVRDSSAGGGGGGFAIRDRWMLSHNITPLAMDILTSKGVSVCVSYSIRI